MSDISVYLENSMEGLSVVLGESCSASFLIGADFPGFNGHFDGNPVLPGVCCIQTVIFLIEKWLGRRVVLDEVVSAKFLAVVAPDAELTVTCSKKSGVDDLFTVKSIVKLIN